MRRGLQPKAHDHLFKDHRAERDIADWLYVRYLQPAVAEGKVFDAEEIDIGRGGVKLRLQEHGAVVFMP